MKGEIDPSQHREPQNLEPDKCEGEVGSKRSCQKLNVELDQCYCGVWSTTFFNPLKLKALKIVLSCNIHCLS